MKERMVWSLCPCCGVDVYIPLVDGKIVDPYIWGDDDFPLSSKGSEIKSFKLSGDKFEFECPRCKSKSECSITNESFAYSLLANSGKAPEKVVERQPE